MVGFGQKNHWISWWGNPDGLRATVVATMAGGDDESNRSEPFSLSLSLCWCVCVCFDFGRIYGQFWAGGCDAVMVMVVCVWSVMVVVGR